MTKIMTSDADSGYSRLEDQIRWYDKKSMCAQRYYKTIKLIEVVCAASISLSSIYCSVIASVTGVLIVVLEAVQQLNQWHANWASYRSTCESLRHEKYCYIEKAGPYANIGSDQARVVLVERVESLISTEHSKWIRSVNNCKVKTDKISEEKSDTV